MSRPKTKPKLKDDKRTGTWYLHWTENGRSKRVSTGTTVYKEALEFQLGREKGEAEIAASADRWSVRRAVDFYVTHKIDPLARSPRTVKDRLKHVTDFLGLDTYLDVITPLRLLEYMAHRRKERGAFLGAKCKDTTINGELSAFRACVKFSVKKGGNEAKIPLIDVGNTNVPKDRWLSNPDLDRLMEAAQGRYKNRLSPMYLWLAIARGTGKRKRVIETLQWDQINMKTWMIDFREKSGRGESSKKKGLSSVTPWLRPILLEAYDQRLNNFVMGSDALRNTCFNRVVKKAGFTGVTMHTIRHSFGTLLAQAGADLFEIAEAMGISERTARTNYIHHCVDFQKRVMEKVTGPAGPGQISVRDTAAPRTRIGARRAPQTGAPSGAFGGR